jgi:outer membrane immunogenic protein
MAVSASAQNSSFRGFYVGGYLGGANGGSNAHTTVVFDPVAGYFAQTSTVAIAAVGNQNLNSKGFNGGATAGFNWQPNRWVFGVEADFGALHVSDKKQSGAIPYPCCPGSTFDVGQQIKSNWMFTARPRVGYTWGKWLVFGTAGVAVANIQYRELFTDTFGGAHETGTMNPSLFGWTAGIGAEYQLHRHWNVKGEYLYAHFGDDSVTSNNLTALGTSWPTSVFTHTTDFNVHIVRGAVNYRF